MNTEMIDRLFLELSQFTNAKTKREIELEARLAKYEASPKPDHEAVRDVPAADAGQGR